MNVNRSDLPEDFTRLPDLAVRDLGGSVVFASDCFYGEHENLVKPGSPQSSGRMNSRGWVVDSWETGRRRLPGHEFVVVRLGVPGLLSGVVVDTAGSGRGFPPRVSIDAASLYGNPSVADVLAATWTPVVNESDALGEQQNSYRVNHPFLVTHVRLNIFPDGSVARLRVHGRAVPDLRMESGLIDVAAVRSGGYAVSASDAWPRAHAPLSPGRGHSIADGWETARHRGPGGESLQVRLGLPASPRLVEIDTFNYLRNAPGQVRVLGASGDAGGQWSEIVPLTTTQPDTRHHFRTIGAGAIDQVKLEIFPDGGICRLRVLADLDSRARASALLRWFNVLESEHAVRVLVGDHEISAEAAREAVAGRPYRSADEAPEAVGKLMADPPWASASAPSR